MEPQELAAAIGPLWADLQQVGLIAKDASWGTVAGALGGLGATLTAALNIYRGPRLQNLATDLAARLPVAKWLVWDNLPGWARKAAPLVISALPFASLAASGKMSWAAAGIAAFTTGVTSIGGHHGRERAGHIAAPVTLRLPPKLRKVTSLVVPLPKGFQAPVIRK